MGDAPCRPVVVAFDFDHTLTTRDSVVPFLRRVATKRSVARVMLGSPGHVVVGVVRRDRDQLRSVATRCFAGLPVDEIGRLADAHATDIVRTGLRDDTVARLRSHLAAGHRVVIVSASYEDYLTLVAAELGVEAVVSSRLEVVDGRCTGRLHGANCRGAEKVRRLEGWLAADGLARGDVELYAYGDSTGDREMLAWADHAIWIDGEPIDPALPAITA